MKGESDYGDSDSHKDLKEDGKDVIHLKSVERTDYSAKGTMKGVGSGREGDYKDLKILNSSGLSPENVGVLGGGELRTPQRIKNVGDESDEGFFRGENVENRGKRVGGEFGEVKGSSVGIKDNQDDNRNQRPSNYDPKQSNHPENRVSGDKGSKGGQGLINRFKHNLSPPPTKPGLGVSKLSPRGESIDLQMNDVVQNRAKVNKLLSPSSQPLNRIMDVETPPHHTRKREGASVEVPSTETKKKIDFSSSKHQPGNQPKIVLSGGKNSKGSTPMGPKITPLSSSGKSNSKVAYEPVKKEILVAKFSTASQLPKTTKQGTNLRRRGNSHKGSPKKSPGINSGEKSEKRNKSQKRQKRPPLPIFGNIPDQTNSDDEDFFKIGDKNPAKNDLIAEGLKKANVENYQKISPILCKNCGNLIGYSSMLKVETKTCLLLESVEKGGAFFDYMREKYLENEGVHPRVGGRAMKRIGSPEVLGGRGFDGGRYSSGKKGKGDRESRSLARREEERGGERGKDSGGKKRKKRKKKRPKLDQWKQIAKIWCGKCEHVLGLKFVSRTIQYNTTKSHLLTSKLYPKSQKILKTQIFHFHQKLSLEPCCDPFLVRDHLPPHPNSHP